MKLPKKLLIISIFPLIACCLLFIAHTARAQTTPVPFNQIFTVIPPRLEINVKPGEFVQKTIQFRNEGDETAYLSAITQDFIVKNTTGTPEFVTSLVSGRWSAAAWMKLAPATLAVPPKAVTNVNLSINVPPDALPGGHYAGVLYQSKGAPQRAGAGLGAGTGIQQTIGTLVYLTVAGPITEEAIVKRFEAAKFLEYGPVNFTTEILNRSDVHIVPKGQITVRNMFGKTVTTLPLDERNIFPGASFVYQNTWPAKNLIGRFRADLAVAYGSGHALTATLYFWVFPWKVVLIALLAIILVILIIWLLLREIRKKRQELEDKLLEEKAEVEELKEELQKRSK